MDDKTQKLQIRMPLIQQLTKYAFFLLCLIIFAPRIINLLDATESRMAEGGEVSIGPAGLKLGEAPKMHDKILAATKIEELSVPSSPTSNAPTKGGGSFSGIGTLGGYERGGGESGGSGLSIMQRPQHDPLEQRPLVQKNGEEVLKDMFYLIHGAKKTKADQYTVKVRLGSHNSKALEFVERVVYTLHETFEDDVREIHERDNDFELTVAAWGQFDLKADVFMLGSEEPIKLRRFLNF